MRNERILKFLEFIKANSAFGKGNYETYVLPSEKNLARLKAPVCIRDLLDSIDLEDLRFEIARNLGQTGSSAAWYDQTFGSTINFKRFLSDVERKVIKASEVNKRAQTQVICHIAQFRREALEYSPNIKASDVISGIQRMKSSVIFLIEEMKTESVRATKEKDRLRRHTQAVNSLGVVSITCNAAAGLLLPVASPSLLVASFAVGTVASKLPIHE